MSSNKCALLLGRVLSRRRNLFVCVALVGIIGMAVLHNRSRHQSNGTIFPNELKLKQEGESLTEFIRNKFLVPPSKEAYNLQQPQVTDPSRGQAAAILKVLAMQKDGFFVECGALDGETRSNTLFMERFLGWQGVLIEADPNNFNLLRQKNRHVWSINACLNNKNAHTKARFKPQFNVGRLAEIVWSDEDVSKKTVVEVDCFPLHEILVALNRTQVDYFSLDVEGAELDVVRSIPFDLLDIRTLSVEYIHTTGGGKEELRRFLEEKGYTVVDEVTQPDNTANDFIMVKNDAFPQLVKQIKQEDEEYSLKSE